MEKKDSIFREKSIQRVSSPEDLDKYLKVTNVSVWLLLVAIIVILTGALIWATVGKIETKLPSACIINNGKASCLIKDEDFNNVDLGLDVKIDENSAKFNIESFSKEPTLFKEDTDEYVLYLCNGKPGDYVYEAYGNVKLPDGTYKASIILDSVSPLIFLFN